MPDTRGARAEADRVICGSKISLREPILLTPMGGAADPAMRAELRVESGGEWAFAAGSGIGFDVTGFAHAGNGRADVGVVEDGGQRHFRKRRTRRDEWF